MTKQAVEACLLRGVCGGLVVHQWDGKAEMVLSDRPLNRSSVPLWHEEMASRCSQSLLYPATVGFSDGSAFSLGTNYDEACSALGVSSIFDLPPSDAMEDVVRDKVAILFGCPATLVRLLHEMGAFLVLVGEGSQELSFSLNEEACITVSLAHPDDGALVDWLAPQTGGADFVVRHGSPVDADLPSMMELCGGITFSLMGEEDHTAPSGVVRIPLGDPKRMMRDICGVFRRI